ncbi:hypothetical protein Taro_046535 [Colocasia esculenta]|uniref:NAC domain-containing protein n=1 Tax=Colocasia esculenta TaxID=4460 RepID=A0A843X694_COLES|nr:hypothetical protein [Colocasia esculenta]
MMVLFGCVPWCYLFHYLFSLMVLSPSDGNAPVDTPGSGEGDREDTSFAADGEVVQQNAPARNLDRLPPGYRFTPQDDELIVFYLRNKLLGLPLPLNKIHDVRLYDHNPKDLAAAHERWEVGKWFFFTPRDRKYPNGSRPSRSAGDGYWKATGADKTIKRNGVLVGWRKALVFYIGRPPKGEKTNWIMHEYRAKDERGPRQFDGTMKVYIRICTYYTC